jgi:rubrerythrin
MNLYNIINEIEKVDPEVYDRLDSRRAAMKNFAGIGKKLALTALPFAVGSMLNRAYGQTSTSTSIVDILNYALTLEYLESTFYAMGVAQGSALITNNDDLNAITIISQDESEHVAFLQNVIPQLGGTATAKPTFDFTAGGTFSDVFTNYQTFLAVAQTFEDTGVRAYKGQAANLMSNATVLTAALNIHSVEARHASKLRQMRTANGFADVTPWITGTDSGIGSAVAASYAGEDNTVQAGIQITGIDGQNISADAASAAFDEPLTMDAVLSIAGSFIVS